MNSGSQVLTLYKQELCSSGPSLRWLGYIGTTSVYGDWEGALVDETYGPVCLCLSTSFRLVVKLIQLTSPDACTELTGNRSSSLDARSVSVCLCAIAGGSQALA